MADFVDRQPDDKLLIKQLRGLDQTALVDPGQMTSQLAARRRRQTSKRMALVIAVPVCLVLISALAIWLAVGQLANDLPPIAKRQVEPELNKVDSSDIEYATDALVSQQLLQAEMRKLQKIQEEVKSLRKLRSQQDWTLAREIVSRSEITQNDLTYKY